MSNELPQVIYIEDSGEHSAIRTPVDDVEYYKLINSYISEQRKKEGFKT